VREVVKAAKFRPLKGAAAETALESGEFPSTASQEYLEARNRDNICIIGIESQAAVDNLDAMLAVPQIDAIFVGPNDMSISLGVPDDYAQEIYKTTVKGVIDQCEARGIPTLVHHQTPELSEYWIEQGARFVLHGTDRRAMAEGFRTEFNRLRNKAAGL
jgi:4-hydroxy-2-oxoheptanedioate aldolase